MPLKLDPPPQIDLWGWPWRKWLSNARDALHNHKHVPSTDLETTGTPSASTFLRGDDSWSTVSVSPTLQDAYDNGTDGIITLDGTNAGVEIRDNATPIGVDLFSVANSAGTNFFAVDADSVNLSVDMDPTNHQGIDLGSGTYWFDDTKTRLISCIGTSTNTGAKGASTVGSRTLGANPTGLRGGNMVEYGSGTALMRHGQGGGAGNPFKPVCTLGNVFVGAYNGDASLINNGGGSFLGGSVYTYGSGAAVLQTGSFGSFTWAYSYGSGAGAHTWTNNGPGGFMGGYSQGAGTVTVDVATQSHGGFIWVRPQASAGGTSDINCQGAGAFVQGWVNNTSTGTNQLGVFANAGDGAFCQGAVQNSGTSAGRIRANAIGAFAQGSVQGGDIFSNARGTFAHGRANVGTYITASGHGAFAAGNATTNDITATALGSFAFGDSASGAISASATNAFQFGVGSNNVSGAFQVGGGGVLLSSTASATVPNVIPDLDDTNTGIGAQAADNLSLIAGGLEGVRVEDPADLVAGETSLWVFDDDNNTIEQVTVGAADSGGTGFKVLRIAN